MYIYIQGVQDQWCKTRYWSVGRFLPTFGKKYVDKKIRTYKRKCKNSNTFALFCIQILNLSFDIREILKDLT